MAAAALRPWRARLPAAPASAPPRSSTTRVFLACGLGWGASLIHVLAAVEHVDEYLLYAGSSPCSRRLQFTWGVALYRRPRRRLLRLGAVGSLAVVALWIVSRTSGLPLGPEPWRPEPVGTLDLSRRRTRSRLRCWRFFRCGPGPAAPARATPGIWRPQPASASSC